MLMLVGGLVLAAGCAAAPTKPTCSTVEAAPTGTGSLATVIPKLRASSCEFEYIEYERMKNRSFWEKLKDGDRRSWLAVGFGALVAFGVVLLLNAAATAGSAKEAERTAAAEEAERREREVEALAAEQAADEERVRQEAAQRAAEEAAAAEREREVQVEMDRIRREGF